MSKSVSCPVSTSVLSFAAPGLAGRLSDVGRIMSRDQLQILESSANRKASVSPSPNTTRGLADLNLTGSEDQTDTSLEPGEVRGGEEVFDEIMTFSSSVPGRSGHLSRQFPGQLTTR